MLMKCFMGRIRILYSSKIMTARYMSYSFLTNNTCFTCDRNKLNQLDNKLRSYFSVDLTAAKYEEIADDTLESLYDYFDALIEKHSNTPDTDVTLASGVLVLNLGKLHGTYVLNRQTPNKQIWLSSPISGPKRYDYMASKQCWVYHHEHQTLHQLLHDEFSKIFKENVDFSKCKYSGRCNQNEQ